jgi:cation diffusion facilitator family transporter
MSDRKAQRAKSRAATFSIIAASVLTGLKLAVGLITNSLAIISLAVDSFFDITGSITAYLSIRFSGRPPDQEHRYGHGKIENLGGLLVTLMLLVTVAYLLYESFNRILVQVVPVVAQTIGVGGIVVSMVVDFAISSYLRKTGRLHSSHVLEVNALQFRMDIWTQALVLVGLIFTTLGYPIVDPIVAILVSIYIAYYGFGIGKKAVDVLLDRAPDELVKRIEEAVKASKDVLRYDNLRIRTAGPQTFVDLRIYVPRVFTLDKAHTIASKVERRIRHVVSGADVVVHVEAEAKKNEEKTADQVRLIASDIPGILGVHDLWLREADGQLEVDVHIQVDSELPLTKGHKVATVLEERLKKKFGRESKITSHIDTEVDRIIYAEPLEHSPEITRKVKAIVLKVNEVKQCDYVSVKRIDSELHVSMTCVLEKDMTVREAHAVASRIENLVTDAIEGVRKVFVHTEPPSG